MVGESFTRVVLVMEWLRTREEMEAGRAAYRARNRRRGRSRMVYPPALAAIGNFPNWLQVKVREEMAAALNFHWRSLHLRFHHLLIFYLSVAAKHTGITLE